MPVPDQFDCIVVGAGIVGACCFAELSRVGKRTLLLDSQRSSMGATAWSGGIIRTAHLDSNRTRKAAFGWHYFKQLHKNNTTLPFFETGHLLFAPPEQIMQLQEDLGDLGIRSEILGQRELCQQFRQLGIKAECALLEADSGFVDPICTTQAVIQEGIYHGGQSREGIEVLGLHYDTGSLSGVDTNIGRFSAESVIFAVGAGLTRLIEACGLVADFVETRLVHVTLFRGQKRLTAAPCFTDEEYDVNGRFCPITGNIYVGFPTNETCSPDTTSQPIQVSHADATWRAGKKRFGWLSRSIASGGLCHSDSYSAHKEGIVGPFPGGPEGLFVATGFCGGGFKMAPYAGHKITSLVVGRDK